MASKDACGKLTTLENTVQKADEQSMRPACQVFDYDTAAVQKAIRDDASANLAVAQQGTDTSLAALATELAAAIAAECADALAARTDVEAADLNGHAQPSAKARQGQGPATSGQGRPRGGKGELNIELCKELCSRREVLLNLIQELTSGPSLVDLKLEHEKVLGGACRGHLAGNFVRCGQLNKERKRLLALIEEREIPVSLAAPPPEASSSTSDRARAALNACLATLRVFKTSAKYEGTLLSNNMKCAKADAPVKDAVAKEDWDLAATCSSEGVNLRAALGKATPHKDQAPPRLATLNPNDDVPLPPAPTKNLHNDLSAMLAYEELLDSTAAAVRAAEAASKRAAMQDLPVACLMRVKDEVLKKYQVSGGGRNLFLAGLKAGP